MLTKLRLKLCQWLIPNGLYILCMPKLPEVFFKPCLIEMAAVYVKWRTRCHAKLEEMNAPPKPEAKPSAAQTSLNGHIH